MPTIDLHDGNYLCHRLHHGMPKLTNKNGEQVGMLVAASKALHTMAADRRPGPTLFAFDSGKCKWREALVPTYKADRTRDEEIEGQIVVVQQMVEAYGLPLFAKKGMEADDIIGTMSRTAYEAGYSVRIHTNDKDMNQLVRKDKVVVIHHNGTVYDSKAIRKKFGFGPERFVDYLALMGDATDGYDGLPGCGEKTAKELIKSGVTVAAMLEDPTCAGSMSKNVIKHRAALEASFKVAKIKRMAKIPVTLDDCKPTSPDYDKLLALFERWGLNAAAKRVAEIKKRPKGLFG